MREQHAEKNEKEREKERKKQEPENSEKGIDRTRQCREYVARTPRVYEDRKSCSERET